MSFFLQAEDRIGVRNVTGVQTCALPISLTVSPSETSISDICAYLMEYPFSRSRTRWLPHPPPQVSEIDPGSGHPVTTSAIFASCIAWRGILTAPRDAMSIPLWLLPREP